VRAYNDFGGINNIDVNINININATDAYDTSFIRDKLGRITNKTETIDGITTDYEYLHDIAGRLEEVKTDNVTTSTYQYDSNSTRIHVNGILRVSIVKSGAYFDFK